MKKFLCLSLLCLPSIVCAGQYFNKKDKGLMYSISVFINSNPPSPVDCGTGGTPPTPKKDDKKDCGTGGTPPTPKKDDGKDFADAEFNYYNDLFFAKKDRFLGQFDSLEEFDKLQK